MVASDEKRKNSKGPDCPAFHAAVLLGLRYVSGDHGHGDIADAVPAFSDEPQESFVAPLAEPAAGNIEIGGLIRSIQRDRYGIYGIGQLRHYIPAVYQGPHAVGVQADPASPTSADDRGELLDHVQPLGGFPVTAEDHLEIGPCTLPLKLRNKLLHRGLSREPEGIRIPEGVSLGAHTEHAAAGASVGDVEVQSASVRVDDAHDLTSTRQPRRYPRRGAGPPFSSRSGGPPSRRLHRCARWKRVRSPERRWHPS